MALVQDQIPFPYLYHLSVLPACSGIHDRILVFCCATPLASLTLVWASK